jgi:hypothetical protein
MSDQPHWQRAVGGRARPVGDVVRGGQSDLSFGATEASVHLQVNADANSGAQASYRTCVKVMPVRALMAFKATGTVSL